MSEQIHGPLRVLIVTGHVLLRQGLRALLQEDFEIVAETDTVKAALALNQEVRPDIVLLDPSLEPSSGVMAVKQLLLSSPGTPIVVLAGSDDEPLFQDARRAGVHGYLQKTATLDELRKALWAVQRGEYVLGEAQAIRPRGNAFQKVTHQQNPLNRGLSTREIEIVRLASKGYTNKEIGTQLYWSEVQVKRKMQEIYRKLHVTDRAQAVAEAIHQGLI